MDVAENWQSEYLQFLLYLLLTVWLLQKGSPESKELGGAGRESEQEQKIGDHATHESPRWARVGGWRTALYSSSLALAMGSIFLVDLPAPAGFTGEQAGRSAAPQHRSGGLVRSTGV